MAKRIFFGFHYEDVKTFRANVVRNHWLTKKDSQDAGFFDASIWEGAQKHGDQAVKRLINSNLGNTSVTCALVGSETWNRRWVRYEILKSYDRDNLLFGVHINSIKDKNQQTFGQGRNVFDYLGFVISAVIMFFQENIIIISWSILGVFVITIISIVVFKIRRNVVKE